MSTDSQTLPKILESYIIKCQRGEDIYVVDVVLHPLCDLPSSDGTTIGFSGKKIQHPFETKTHMSGKIPISSYTGEFCSPDDKEALENPFGIFVKLDGSNGCVVRIKNGWMFCTRLDLGFKNGKILVCGVPYDSAEQLLALGFIPCGPDPRIECPDAHHSKLHYPWMVPIARYVNDNGHSMEIINSIPRQDTAKIYKWNLVAFQNAIDSKLLDTIPEHITQISVEQMGKQFNLKDEDIFPSTVGLVPHNSIEVIIPDELRTFEGMVAVLKAIPNIEGVIIYGKNGKILKFRRNMILDDDSAQSTDNLPRTLKWGKGKTGTDWAHQVALL